MISAHPANPLRPVHWRWEYCKDLRECKLSLQEAGLGEDRWLTRTYRFQQALWSAITKRDYALVYSRFADVYGAYCLWRGCSTAEPTRMAPGASEQPRELRSPCMPRYAIEARVLSGQSDEDIVDRMGYEYGAVRAFSPVFFDVRPKLRYRDYILTAVIGPSVQAGLSQRDYDLLWKIWGFLHGPFALEWLIETYPDARHVTREEVKNLPALEHRWGMYRAGAVGARVLEIGPETQRDVMELYFKLIEIETAAGTLTRDRIIEALMALLAKLNWRPAGEHAKMEEMDPALLLPPPEPEGMPEPAFPRIHDATTNGVGK